MDRRRDRVTLFTVVDLGRALHTDDRDVDHRTWEPQPGPIVTERAVLVPGRSHELRGDRPLPLGFAWPLIWNGEPAGSRDDDDIADAAEFPQRRRPVREREDLFFTAAAADGTPIGLRWYTRRGSARTGPCSTRTAAV